MTKETFHCAVTSYLDLASGGEPFFSANAVAEQTAMIASGIQTPADLSLIYSLAQISMPPPYFETYFAWPIVRRLLQPMAGQTIRVADTQVALMEMAESMRELVNMAGIHDPAAVPAIKRSLFLIEAMRMALRRRGV